MFAVFESISHQFYRRFKPALPVPNPTLQKHLDAIENRLRGAIHFLKKNTIVNNSKKITLDDLPWYLLIGACDVGKTTLLRYSNIKFILDKKIKSDPYSTIPKSEKCDWWVTSNSVLVDVPGNYVTTNVKNSLANRSWQHFVSSVQKLRPRKGIAGVIVVISIAELINPLSLKKSIAFLDGRITELRNKFDTKLPFYLLISKCDLLPGFLEFFGGYTIEERSQVWGIPLDKGNKNQNLKQLFLHRFDKLIKKLNSQVVGHLHHERSLQARFYLKDFPLHVEHTKQLLLDLLMGLSAENRSSNLKGIYLTSGIQYPNQAIKQEVMALNKETQGLAILKPPTVTHAHSFFVKQFLLQALVPETKTYKFNFKSYALGLTLACLFFSGGFFCINKIINTKHSTLSPDIHIATTEGIQKSFRNGDHLV